MRGEGCISVYRVSSSCKYAAPPCCFDAEAYSILLLRLYSLMLPRCFLVLSLGSPTLAQYSLIEKM